MKAFVVLALIGSALAAPAEDIQDLQRTKKSAYGAPCAGAGPIAPVALYLSAAPQGPSLSHYREDEHKEEHLEQERSYYGAPSLAAAASAPALASAASGSAVGLFPNAKVGGCAVPLLLSCAPNVVSGHLAHGAGAYGGSAYRTQEPEHHNHNHNHMDVREAPEHDWSDKAQQLQAQIQSQVQQKAAQLQEAHASHHHHAIITDFPLHHHPQNIQF